jgi:hypothetical protein
MKAYLITFSGDFATRDKVTEHIDSWPEIPFWYCSMPNCVFITSDLSASAIAEKLEKHFDVSDGKRFLVAELNSNAQGRLPKQAWHLMANPDNPRLPEEKTKK